MINHGERNFTNLTTAVEDARGKWQKPLIIPLNLTYVDGFIKVEMVYFIDLLFI